MNKHEAEISITVTELFNLLNKEMKIELIAGKNGTDKAISQNRVQKIGLRMIDPEDKLDKGKVLILGLTEIDYYNTLSSNKKKNISLALTSMDIPCIIITKGIESPAVLTEYCDLYNTPLFITDTTAGKIISLINSILDEKLAPFISVHGVLLDIHGLGVLILGKSGVGKSECALDLILKGSKLIADDLVEIRKIGSSRLIGSGPKNIRHFIEIRGIGIINIKDLIGSTSVMEKREIDMVIELEHWNPDTEYDRVGDTLHKYEILEIDLPYVKIPVSPGRNLDTIVEIAVRNHIFRTTNLN